jgi:hypothetical protein
MAQVQRTLSAREILDFLNESVKKEPYKMKGHSFTPLKGVGKSYCKNCGLIALNNRISEWCVDKGCDFHNHIGYKSALAKYAGGIKKK